MLRRSANGHHHENVYSKGLCLSTTLSKLSDIMFLSCQHCTKPTQWYCAMSMLSFSCRRDLKIAVCSSDGLWASHCLLVVLSCYHAGSCVSSVLCYHPSYSMEDNRRKSLKKIFLKYIYIVAIYSFFPKLYLLLDVIKHMEWGNTDSKWMAWYVGNERAWWGGTEMTHYHRWTVQMHVAPNRRLLALGR